jgi:hypothetical protein
MLRIETIRIECMMSSEITCRAPTDVDDLKRDDMKWNVVIVCIVVRKVCAPSSQTGAAAL